MNMEKSRVDHVPHETCQFVVLPICDKPILLIQLELKIPSVVGEPTILLKALDEAIFLSS